MLASAITVTAPSPDLAAIPGESGVNLPIGPNVFGAVLTLTTAALHRPGAPAPSAVLPPIGKILPSDPADCRSTESAMQIQPEDDDLPRAALQSAGQVPTAAYAALINPAVPNTTPALADPPIASPRPDQNAADEAQTLPVISANQNPTGQDRLVLLPVLPLPVSPTPYSPSAPMRPVFSGAATWPATAAPQPAVQPAEPADPGMQAHPIAPPAHAAVALTQVEPMTEFATRHLAMPATAGIKYHGLASAEPATVRPITVKLGNRTEPAAPTAAPATGPATAPPAPAPGGAAMPRKPDQRSAAVPVAGRDPAANTGLSAKPEVAQPLPLTHAETERPELLLPALRTDQPATAAPTFTPARPAAAAAEPLDFLALIDRIEASREAIGMAPVTLSILHKDFGPVGLRFDAQPDQLSIDLTSSDPEFARAVAAAQTAPIASGSGHQAGLDGQRADSGARSQHPAPDAQHQGGHGTSHSHEGQSHPGRSGARHSQSSAGQSGQLRETDQRPPNSRSGRFA